MSVVLVCPYSLSLPGGVQGQVLGLARTLRQRGVTAACSAPATGRRPKPGVISVGPSVSLAANGCVAPLAPDPKAIRRTLEVLAAVRPDVLHLHEPLVPGPALAALLAGSGPGGGHVPRLGAGSRLCLAPAGGPGRGPAHRVADGRIARGPGAGRALARRRLPRPAQRRRGRPVRQGRAPGRPPETPGGSGRAILFVGRHEPRKGLEVLLEAFSALDPDAVLWVAGEGPETAALAAATPGNVEWLGRISDEELAARLRTAAVFCAPSLHGESFGVVLLEAMAAGTPVVASDIAGYRDVARHDGEAVLVPGGDPPPSPTAPTGPRRPRAVRSSRRSRDGPGGRVLDGTPGRPLRRAVRNPAGPNALKQQEQKQENRATRGAGGRVATGRALFVAHPVTGAGRDPARSGVGHLGSVGAARVRPASSRTPPGVRKPISVAGC